MEGHSPPPIPGRGLSPMASSTADVLAKHKFGQLHHVGSQRPLGVGRPAAVSHGACRSSDRLPYSDGDGGHRLGRCTGSQTGPFGSKGACWIKQHPSQHLYIVKLGSWHWLPRRYSGTIWTWRPHPGAGSLSTARRTGSMTSK